MYWINEANNSTIETNEFHNNGKQSQRNHRLVN